jgi:Tol biopolymer transport system component
MRFLRLLSTTVIAVAVTSTIGFASSTYATFPGRNGLIVFRAATGTGSTAHTQIYTLRSNGQDLRQLTHVVGDAASPAWSANGRRIVFEFDPSNGSCSSIEIMNQDGSGLVDLTTDPKVCESYPSFTPDGSHIVYERYDPATNVDAIWIMNLNGEDRHEITAGPAGATEVSEPEVSPNGRLLSFTAFNGKNAGVALYTAHIDGSHLFQVLPFAFDVGRQVWAPDGRHIAFSYDADTLLPGLSPNIATIRPDGSHVEYLTHYPGGHLGAFLGSCSPNGQWILFRLTDLENHRYALYRMNTGGGALHVILPFSSFLPRQIEWGPAIEH